MKDLCLGKNLTLMQAEGLACVSELVNVPNLRWLVALSMKHNATCVFEAWGRLELYFISYYVF